MRRNESVLGRYFDLVLACLLAPMVACACLGLGFWLVLRQGRPVLHVSDRVGQGGRMFRLLKFRTMHPASDAGLATGGDKAGRITAAGQWLRATRLDELPQLWNILWGDMGFVGPRPPLPRYVEMHPELYDQVLRIRPGLTGLATLIYHRTEARLLRSTQSAAETDRIYARRCVPRKARLDLIHQANRSLRLDCGILWRTLFGPGPKRLPQTERRDRSGKRLQVNRHRLPRLRQKHGEVWHPPGGHGIAQGPHQSGKLDL